MDERIEKELALLQRHYSKVNYTENGQWVHLEDYLIPSDLSWNRKTTNYMLPDSPGISWDPTLWVLCSCRYIMGGKSS